MKLIRYGGFMSRLALAASQCPHLNHRLKILRPPRSASWQPADYLINRIPAKSGGKRFSRGGLIAISDRASRPLEASQAPKKKKRKGKKRERERERE